MTITLTINNKVITLEPSHDGLYCLNDIHKASGGEHKNIPAKWKRYGTGVIDLYKVKTIKGKYGGSYGNEEAVYAYAAWLGISVEGKHTIINVPRKELQFGEEIVNNLFSAYTVIPQYPVLNGKYRIDWYIVELNLAIEYDEVHHKRQKEEDEIRQYEITQELQCKWARYKE